MKSEFLHKDNTGRLIIIFAGWSTEPDFYRHISLSGWDLLIVYDYSDIDFDASAIDSYHTVALFAWSLGVFAASMVIPADRIALAVAVNGTESPVDDEFGIPVKIFNGTAQTLNERNLTKFRRRMFGNPPTDHTLGLNETHMALAEAKDDIDHLRSQLEFIACISKNNSKYSDTPSPEDSDINPSQYSAKNSSNGNINWNRVYISGNDLIFPSKSQKRAWEIHPSRPEIIELLDSPHYVDLNRIIKSALPAKESVGKLFHKALSTYDSQAIAQRTIAEHLTDFPGGVPLSPKKVLEIGPGSGVFSKLFAKRFHPDRIDFVELYALPSFGIAPEENYFVADAEDWVAQEALTNPGVYDAIISASALQWFANPDSFFQNVAKLLCPGGFILCSTFVPGNLKEMESVNPYGLIYRPIDEMERIVRKYFMFSKLEEEELIVGFDSPQQTLRHLKETGVGGGISTGRTPRQLLGSTPLILTYRPLYIYAVTSPPS